MSKLFVSLAALVVLTVPPLCQADEPSTAIDPPALFKQLDTNGDGLLAEDEIPSDKQSLFGRLVRIGDGNADGKLSADEFAVGLTGGKKRPAAKSPASPEGPAKAKPGRPGKAERPGPGQLFARLDANGDGKVVLDEVPAERQEMFSNLIKRRDKDGDGALSRAEFVPENPVRQASTARPQPARDPALFFKRIDANADGKVVADEAPEARREAFARMIKRADKDGDNAMSLEEFQAIAARMRPEGAKPEAAPESPQKKKKPSKPAKEDKAKKKAAKAAAIPAGLFRTLDTDQDGQLSGSEISAASEAILKLDADGDGTVSLREVAAAGNVKKKKKPK